VSKNATGCVWNREKDIAFAAVSFKEESQLIDVARLIFLRNFERGTRKRKRRRCRRNWWSARKRPFLDAS